MGNFIKVEALSKEVKLRQFKPGKLVLKHIFLHQNKANEKFTPNWKGRNIVHQVLTGETLILAKIDGEVRLKCINADVVKIYYV